MVHRVDVFYNGKDLPFEKHFFDSVFCGEVIEHVFNPREVLREINRVLKEDGILLLTVPFCWNEHEIPFNYARYSSFGIKHLLAQEGFETIKRTKSGSFFRVLFQLLALYFFELFKSMGKKGYVLSLFFIVPINLFGSLILALLPKNTSLYFNNIVVSRKITKARNYS